jgi:hypothetical protein
MNKRSVTTGKWSAVFALLSLSTLGVALADAADPPGRVARLSYTQGSVSLEPAGVQDWTAATVNRPLTTGDKLWTDQDARAELNVGSTAIRLGSTTGFSIVNLDDRTAQMQVTAGVVIVHVGSLAHDQTIEVDTPNLAVSLLRPGDYRVEVSDAGDATVVKVSDGAAQASGSGQSVALHTQQMVTFTGSDQLVSHVDTLGAPDSLDEWSLDRDRRAERAQARRYVSTEVAGYEDLDENGRWQSVPDYGNVWIPTTVAVGWAPYRFGRWVWISPWGWTWVDDAPWGYAPFHYGRWAYLSDSWCWVPGPRWVQPIYAPALVAWVGGSRFGVSVAARGGVGWLPLGPRDVYVPAYHVSNNYVRNVNISNTTIVNNTSITNVYRNRVNNIHYVNQDMPGAVTAVSQNTFTSGQPVGENRMHIPERDIGRISATAAAPAISPSRQSVLGVEPREGLHRPPAALMSRPVVARLAPPPAPAPFERQQEAIRANGGRPLAQDQMVRLQPQTPAVPVRMVSPTLDARHVPPVEHAVTAPQTSQPTPGAPAAAGDDPRGMAARERALRSTQLPPVQERPLRNDRPPSAPPPPVAGQDRMPPPQNRGLHTEREPTAQQGRPAAGYRSFVPPVPPVTQPAQNDRPPSAQQERPSREDRLITTPQPALRNDRPPVLQQRSPEFARPAQVPERAIHNDRPAPVESRPIEQPRIVPERAPPPVTHVEQRPMQELHPAMPQPRPPTPPPAAVAPPAAPPAHVEAPVHAEQRSNGQPRQGGDRGRNPQ